MDLRYVGRYPQIRHYNVPIYIQLIGTMISTEQIHLKKNRDGNNYISFYKDKHIQLYEVLEQTLILPKNSIEEVNINLDNKTLDLYSNHSISKTGLDNLNQYYTLGYGLHACIGIHILIKEYLPILFQIQSCIDGDENKKLENK